MSIREWLSSPAALAGEGITPWDAFGAGTAGIESERADVYNSNTQFVLCLVNVGETDGVLRVDIPIVGAATTPSAVFRFVDVSNYLRVQGDGTAYTVIKRMTQGSGAPNTVIGAPFGAVADGDRLEISYQGSTAR